jgi:hypothetical protein
MVLSAGHAKAKVRLIASTNAVLTVASTVVCEDRSRGMRTSPPSSDALAVRDSDAVDRLFQWLAQQYRDYGRVFWVVLGINIVALIYAFAYDIYTNHTFPDALPFRWPSFRTHEGRWITDLCYQLMGGSGLPLFSRAIAVCAQVINGILFARIIGLRSAITTGLCAALVSVHPFILDYYGFSGDDMPYSIGDTMLLAAIALSKDRWWQWATAAILISLSLGTYQPKISLMLTVVVLASIAALLRAPMTYGRLRVVLRAALANGLCVCAGATLYLVELRAKQTVLPAPDTSYFADRTSLAPISQVVSMVLPILSNLRDRLFRETHVFPLSAGWMLSALLVMFVIFGVRQLRARALESGPRVLAVAVFSLSLLLLPLCLYVAPLMSALLTDAGRFYVGFAYVTAFLILMGHESVQRLWARRAWLALGCWLVGGFAVRDCQVLHRAYLSTTQELSIVLQVALRVQQEPRFDAEQQHPLVVFGYPPHGWPDLKLDRGGIISNFERRAFSTFRQVEALNFYVGREAFRYPTEGELTSAGTYASTHAVWPAAESVAVLDDGTTVVVFEQPGENVEHTMQGK